MNLVKLCFSRSVFLEENNMEMCVCLLSQYALPYDGIGSWTQRVNFYLKNSEENYISDLICPHVDFERRYAGVNYHIVSSNWWTKLAARIHGKRHKIFTKRAVKLAMRNDGRVVFVVVDNTGLLFELNSDLERRGIRQRSGIIFFSAGYSYFFEEFKSQKLYNSPDTFVFQSRASYLFELGRTHTIPCKVKILPNGIDLGKFNNTNIYGNSAVVRVEKQSEKIYFLWCSNDRKKKGLHIALEAWKKSKLSNNVKYELMVIGSKLQHQEDNVRFLGKLSGSDLVKYYNVADFYLFTTLCHEGHPLSLSEALASGCKCIVSDLDPLRETHGRFGGVVFVKDPNLVDSWRSCLDSIDVGELVFPNLDQSVITKELSIDTWMRRFGDILKEEARLITQI